MAYPFTLTKLIGLLALILVVLGAGWFYVHLLQHRSATIVREVASIQSPWQDSTSSTVKVFSVEKVSTGLFDPQDIRTTRIEVNGSFAQSLTLPLSADFAARSAESVRLQADETKELLLRKDAFSIAVVWFGDGKLRFRQGADILKSWAFEVGPYRIDRDMVFVSASEFPAKAYEPVPLPRLFSWTTNDGFVDVTGLHPSYVNDILIRKLEVEVSSESNPARIAYYRQVLAELHALSRSRRTSNLP